MKREKSNRWKTRILSVSSKIWKTSKYFDKDIRQVVLSAKKIRKRKKKKRNKEETTTKSNLLKWTVREEKRHWIKHHKPTWNQWKRSYQLDWISILCLATSFAYLQFWISGPAYIRKSWPFSSFWRGNFNIYRKWPTAIF